MTTARLIKGFIGHLAEPTAALVGPGVACGGALPAATKCDSWQWKHTSSAGCSTANGTQLPSITVTETMEWMLAPTAGEPGTKSFAHLHNVIDYPELPPSWAPFPLCEAAIPKPGHGPFYFSDYSQGFALAPAAALFAVPSDEACPVHPGCRMLDGAPVGLPNAEPWAKYVRGGGAYAYAAA